MTLTDALAIPGFVTRFEAREWDQRGDCRLWRGKVSKGGYGQVSVRHDKTRSYFYAHRVSYALAFGLIPGDLQVCHTCDVNYDARDITYRRCYNAAHFFLGTQADNTRDMWAKGRVDLPGLVHRGADCHWSKVDESAVQEVRRLCPDGNGPFLALAEQYGVHVDTIRLIARGKTWKHVA